MKLKLIALALSFLSTSAFAEAPLTDVGGSAKINVDTGVVINAGLSLFGDTAIDTSISSVHGDSNIGGDLTLDVKIGNLAGVSIVNVGASIGGSLCTKTAIGSLGASTCDNTK